MVNQIGAALVERIIRAAQAGDKFRVRFFRPLFINMKRLLFRLWLLGRSPDP